MKFSLGKPKVQTADDFYNILFVVGIGFFYGGVMLTSLAFIFLIGLLFATISEQIGLPKIIGMLIAGILLGPYVFNVLDESILSISSDLRKWALIIILIKAGLTLNLKDLKQVGRPAVLFCFLPASFEILGFLFFGPRLLHLTTIDALIMGTVLAAVSPAVVVPRMVHLIEEGYGTDKRIPQMILAGASCDDIYVIVLFTTLVNMAKGEQINLSSFLQIPSSFVFGILLGAVFGILLLFLFKSVEIQNSIKVILILGFSFFLVSIENWLESIVSVSGLLAILSMACVLKEKSEEKMVSDLSKTFGEIWLAAEILLFVLVGAAVDVRYTLQAGPIAIILIFIALAFRSVGVCLCTWKTKLNFKERVFCVVAYLPKATVQAAIGSIPLAMGLSCGQMVLSVSVLAILITAPLGAIGIDRSYAKLLKNNHTIENE